METRNIVLAIVSSALLSSVITAFVMQQYAGDSATSQTDTAAYDQRFQKLEDQLAQERENLLSLRHLMGQMRKDRADSALENSPASPSSEEEFLANSVDLSDAASLEEITRSAEQRRAEAMADYRARFEPAYKFNKLRDAGFSEEEASRIIGTESEVMLEQLQAQYDARRKALEEGDPNSPWNRYGNNGLREKLGEDLYERYLEANERPTSIGVGSVMQNSPGANAGLQAGDVIVAYDNKRVFDVTDLNRLTAQGNLGESMLLEIERNGNPMQLTIPRGPIGVTPDGTGYRRPRQ